MKAFVTVVILLSFMVTETCCKKESRKIIGVKIYEHNDDFDILAQKWEQMGINTAFMSKDLASRTDLRKILKDKKINVYVIFPVFFDTEKLRHDTLLYAITNKGKKAKDDWVEFICPSRKAYRDLKVKEALEIVRQLKPDGLSIDFIRQFVFWEMVYPDREPQSIEMACFCDSCINNFCRIEKIELPDSIKEPDRRADFILKNHSIKWNNYRTDLIAVTIKEIAEQVKFIQPDIKINVHVVPWRDEDFGGANIRVAAQDLIKIALFTDYISPIYYSQMVRRDDRWIASAVAEMDKKAPGKILPSIQVYPYYVEDPFSPGDFGKCIDAALEGKSRGVVFFSWPLFEKDPERMNVLEEKYKKGSLENN